jgi:hypothetical protein
MEKSCVVSLPPKIVIRGVDNVTYATITGDKEQLHRAAPCYQAHMAQLNKYTFKCIASTRVSVLPEREYLLWMQYCHTYGLVPTGSTFWREKGQNIALIPGKYETRHRLYTGLCCYRWADSLAPLPYTVVHLLDHNPQLHFMQVLHYAMGKFVTLVGHSFSNVAANNMGAIYGGSGAARLNVLYGLGTKLFYQFDESGSCPAREDKTVSTQAALHGFVTKKVPLTLSVKKHENLLSEHLTPIYMLDKYDPEFAKAQFDIAKKAK